MREKPPTLNPLFTALNLSKTKTNAGGALTKNNNSKKEFCYFEQLFYYLNQMCNLFQSR